MNPKSTHFILIGIIALLVTAGAIAYPMLPDQVASHWNAAGEADGYMSKFWGTFLLPLIMAVLFLVYAVIPKIDPLKKNIESFLPVYGAFWIWTFIFLAYIFCLSLLWNLGHQFNFTTAIIPGIAALLYVIGGMLEKAKRNWFIGIRTPWTLSNDVVWDKTHKLGGRLFKIAALVSLTGVLFHDTYSIAAIAIPIALVTVVTVVYSYLEYRKLNRPNNS